MKKLLLFHPALAPYRVDQFNALSQLFDLEVVFVYDNVWNHNFDQSKLLPLLQFKFSFLLKGPAYKGRVFRFGMLKTIKRTNPDIILGYEYSFTTQYLVFLKHIGLVRQKIGSTIDDCLATCHKVQSVGRYHARNRTVKHLDYFILLSPEVSEFYQKTFNLKQHQIVVSPILQQPERLRNNSERLETIATEYTQQYGLKGKKVLLFVGRLIPEKAIKEFINAVHPVLHQHKDLVFMLVGDGGERQAIEELVTEKKLEKKIFLPGRFEGEELYAWYLCASGFVLPSLSEAFGAVVNEALIFGLKVFCSKYAGAACLIEDDNGITFNPTAELETNEKLNAFLNLIDPVEDICITNRPSLMQNCQEHFLTEWGKLTE